MSFVPVEECYKNSSLSHCERPVPARTTPGNTHAGLTHISARSTQQQVKLTFLQYFAEVVALDTNKNQRVKARTVCEKKLKIFFFF